jgi:hypothetical protein
MRQRLPRILLKSLGLWLVGALAIAIPISQINLVQFYRLKEEGVRAKGMVTKLEPGNHQSVYYSFVLSGRIYSGIGRAGFGNPEFCCLTVGQSLIVYYLPSDPFVSCSGVPLELIRNELPPIVLAGFFFPLFAMAVYTSRFPRFRQWLLCEEGKPTSGG